MHNKHDAEDVLQDTLIQFLRTRPTLTGAEHEKAWLMRVAANTSKNRLKSQRIRQADNVDELGESLASEDSSDLSFVWEAVRDLPVQQREVIHLFYQEGYSIKEIARILDRSATTVRSDMFRGRNKLRTILKEAYDFE